MKEFIEIPFGAKDSELCGWEYTIPEGYTASIENGKIVVKKEEREDEKIRKVITLIIKGIRANVFEEKGISKKNTIAWLEKQGENISLPKFTFDDVLALQCAMEAAKKVQKDKDLYEQLKSLHDRLHDAYWLEKQGNIDKASYEIAEKEKYDFVNGQFIQCRKSFDEFKEYNSYWFEYIGNDTYVGRSDNILNKKFHITPRQLYRLFTQQHYYYSKENNEFEKQGESKFEQCIQEGDKIVTNEDGTHFNVSQLERVAKKATETEETAKEFLKSAEIMDENGKLADEYRLEKQGEKPQDANYPKFNFDDVLALQCCMETVKKVQEDKELYEKLTQLHSKVHDAYWLEKQGKHDIGISEATKQKLEDNLNKALEKETPESWNEFLEK